MRTLFEILSDELEASHPMVVDPDFDDYDLDFSQYNALEELCTE